MKELQAYIDTVLDADNRDTERILVAALAEARRTGKAVRLERDTFVVGSSAPTMRTRWDVQPWEATDAADEIRRLEAGNEEQRAELMRIKELLGLAAGGVGRSLADEVALLRDEVKRLQAERNRLGDLAVALHFRFHGLVHALPQCPDCAALAKTD